MNHIFDQTKLYATQNGREFTRSSEEIRVFISTNYMMTIKATKFEVQLAC